MDKFKLLRIVKKRKENELKREEGWNDRFYVKENNTPNKISLNKTRTHIKIKSRDIKSINPNNYTEDEANSKININTHLITENKTILPLPKPKLKPNQTLNNLLNKLHKKEKEKEQKIGINKNNQNNNELYNKVLNLWEELGVNYVYQSIFNKIIANLNKEKKELYYKYEYNRLNNIYNIINLIIIDIDNREKIIFDLQNNYYYDKENEEKIIYDEETIKNVLNMLVNLRKYTIDILNNIILLRKEIGYDLFMNKFDKNKIFIFPNDYIIKMNNDLDFLINSPLNKYFNFSKSDPFITKINTNNSNKYKLPELKEENIISLINNFDNIYYDELINQEVNIMTINSKNSFDSIFNFTSKNKIIKKKNNIIKNIHNNTNKIIKANRGLSRQKLKPKINIPKNQEKKFSSDKINKSNSKSINHNFKYTNNRIFQNEKNNEEDNQLNINFNNIHNNPINEDDIKIFERFIEQSIMEKNNIDKEVINNKIKINKNEKIYKRKNKKEEIISKSNTINKKNSKEYDDLDSDIIDNSIKKENSLKKKNENLKKQISNFIKDILEESEIENSQNISISRNNILNKDNNNNNNEIDYDLDNIEIEAEPIKKIYPNFTIELYNDKLSSLKDIYNNYYKKIPEKIKKGFNVGANIIKYIKGIYPKILLIKSNNNTQILGIITLNYLENNSNSIIVRKAQSNNYNKILNISSISCINESQFEDILINCIDFCEEFFNLEYIILELYYLNENGKFILYSDLEKIIKNKAKFKWVNMENDGKNRKIKYRYTKKYDNKNINNEINNNIINLKSINLIGYEDENNYNNMDIRQLSLINDFSINYLLLEMIGQNNFTVIDKKNDENNYINSIINKITFKRINHICADFLVSQIGDSNDIKNFIKENENFINDKELFRKINEKIFNDLYFGISIININNSFKNIIKRKYKGYIYNILFNDQINEFSIKDNNNNDMNFYLIKSSDQNISIIIYEFKNNESLEDIKKILYNNKNTTDFDDEKNISEIFKELFSKVTKKPIKINKNIYIPSFKILTDQFAFRPSIFSEVILENEENFKNYKINSLNIIEELSFGIDEPFIIQQNVMNLDEEFENNIIIKNDFILSIVNNDLIFELQIPTVSTFLINKSFWIKSS